VSARASAAVLVALLALAAACGVRTDPRPPEDTAARPPDGFRVKAVTGGVELRWERTTRAMDGDHLYDLASFVVERRTDGGAFQTIATIPVTDTDRLRTQKVFHFVGDAPGAGTPEYRVRAVAADGERGVPTETLAITAPAASGEAPPPAEQAPPTESTPAARSR